MERADRMDGAKLCARGLELLRILDRSGSSKMRKRRPQATALRLGATA